MLGWDTTDTSIKLHRPFNSSPPPHDIKDFLIQMVPTPSIDRRNAKNSVMILLSGPPSRDRSGSHLLLLRGGVQVVRVSSGAPYKDRSDS